MRTRCISVISLLVIPVVTCACDLSHLKALLSETNQTTTPSEVVSGYQILYSFKGIDGAHPFGTLLMSSDGVTLYGLTYDGGTYTSGNIFEFFVDSSILVNLHDFGSSHMNPVDGELPMGAFTFSDDESTLYAMSQGDTDGRLGALIGIDRATGVSTVLHIFGDGSVTDDGASPIMDNGIVVSPDGTMLYGMTAMGGVGPDEGVIFSYGPLRDSGGISPAYTILHRFGDGTVADDGAGPYDKLVYSADGTTLYGVTSCGGLYGLGTLFKFAPENGSGVVTILHHFGDADVSNDGTYPHGSLMRSPTGDTFYGMTNYGGHYGMGTIYQYVPDGSLGTTTVLYSFGSVSADGQNPEGALVISEDGNFLYGMTLVGGSAGYGMIFKYEISNGAYEILHNFGDGSQVGDGMVPYGSLILSPSGNALYGMTEQGGDSSAGVVFTVLP